MSKFQASSLYKWVNRLRTRTSGSPDGDRAGHSQRRQEANLGGSRAELRITASRRSRNGDDSCDDHSSCYREEKEFSIVAGTLSPSVWSHHESGPRAGIFESLPMNFSAVTRNMRTTHALLLRARTSGPGVHGLTPLATHIKIQRENGGLPGND